MDRRISVRALTRGGTAPGRAQAGFTLLEMIVSVALFTVVTGAIYGLLRVGTSDRFTTNQRAELLQNARIALNAISADALNAGFDFPDEGAQTGPGSLVLFGLPNDPLQNLDTLRPVTARNNVNANSLNPTAGTLTDQVTFTYVDDSFNPDVDANPLALSVGPFTGSQNRNAVIQNPPATIPTRTGDVYIVTGATSTLGYCSSASGANLVFGTVGDALTVNARPGGTNMFVPVVTHRLRRVRCVSYYVDANGTLMRLALGDRVGGAGYIAMPIAEGVENMQVEYVLQSGAVVTTPTPAETGTIRQVRVVLQIRSPDMDERSNDFFRTTLASTVNTRNITYRR
jgi:type IV pilus assembly protein PilW